jgi:SpoVK/Ycf46/Vps4 family AAA+-type ATPase
MEAARRAMRRGGGRPVPITAEDFEEVLRGMRPSVTFQMLREYQRIAERYQRRAGPTEIRVERPEDLPT